MIWKLIVRDRANTDLQNAQDWYDRQQKGLGGEFVAAVNDAFAVLQQNPHVCQVY